MTNGYQFGLFNSSGTRVWTSGAVTTTVGMTSITANLPVTLPAGQYYWVTTNNGLTSGTAALQAPAAPTTNLPRMGTVAAVGGAMPASLTPTGITRVDWSRSRST